MCSQIPELVYFSNFQNNWDKYLNALYDLYIEKIVKANLSFMGLPIHYQFRPLYDGKGFGFWHLISEGEKEENRVPNFQRCERLLWIPWMISCVEKNPDIQWYENERNGTPSIVLWLKEQGYVIILSKRNGYYLLKTAYPLSPHREKTIKKEWKEYWNKG